uniref:Galectin n=1 Tax=Cebus imitator TaxID=2715852 RepID=A0A2K5RZ75_CEBIM
VPYAWPVSLSVGSCVRIRVTPILSFVEDPQLQVDFHTGTNEESDTTFHFQVNFGHWVAVNSDVYGVWWSGVTCHNIPFEDGKPFDLHVSVLDNEHQVMVNNKYCYSFAHLLPLCCVRMLRVCGDVSVTSVCVDG